MKKSRINILWCLWTIVPQISTLVEKMEGSTFVIVAFKCTVTQQTFQIDKRNTNLEQL